MSGFINGFGIDGIMLGGFDRSSGGAGPISSTKWRLRFVTTQAGGNDSCSVAGIMFMVAADAGAQPDSGAPLESGHSSTAVAANAFDGVAATYWNYNVANAWIGFEFNSTQIITHVSITARNESVPSYSQAPRSFYIDYDNGAGWVQYKYGLIGAFTNGSTNVFALSDGFSSSDLSAFDEVGGHRFWLIKNTGNTYQGFDPSYQPEFRLKQGGQTISTEFVDNGGTYASHAGGSLPFDTVTSDAGYFELSIGNHAWLDFGYKRLPTSVSVVHRTFASGIQGMKQYEVWAGNTDETIGTMTLIKAVNDTLGPNPPGAGAEVEFSIP